MTNKAQITQQAARDEVPAPTVERDYVLAHIIAGLASLGADHGVIFKGGTALRLCYFDDYRYSADLDFSLVAGDIDHAYGVITDALNAVTGAIELLELTEDNPPKIAYQGPLGRQRTLKLDIADDELVMDTAPIGLLPRWDDLPEGVTLPGYTLPEIAGEKIRCIMQRLQCRDLFDLSLLLGDGYVDPVEASHIFIPKAEHKGLDPNQFAERYAARVDQYRHRWENELQQHVPGNVPHFEQTERHVARDLRSAGLL